MALFSVTSTNPDLSYVLRKNPLNGMIAKRIRQGTGYGFFSEDAPAGSTRYTMFFQEMPEEISYKLDYEQEYDHLDTGKFSSPLWVIGAITEFLASAYKTPAEQDVVGPINTVEIPMLRTARKGHLMMFARYFEDYNFEFTEHADVPRLMGVRITSKTKTLRELLNLTLVLMLFVAIKNDEVQDVPIEKYLGCLNVIDAPYFVRYVFKINLLRNREKFEKHVQALSQTTRNKIEFSRFDLGTERLKWVDGLVNDGETVIDVGCGEGRYVKLLARRSEEYVAIDKDPEQIEIIKRVKERKQYENLLTADSVQTALDMGTKFKGATVLLMEVIEHNTLKEAQALLTQLVALQPRQILISTPNVDFNQFYEFEDDESRHDEHHFEFTPAEFESFLRDTLAKIPGNQESSDILGVMQQISAVGDKVEGIQPTQVARLQITQ